LNVKNSTTGVMTGANRSGSVVRPVRTGCAAGPNRSDR
jgi:hypothetical protein